jgi:hypothetical protein
MQQFFYTSFLLSAMCSIALGSGSFHRLGGEVQVFDDLGRGFYADQVAWDGNNNTILISTQAQYKAHLVARGYTSAAAHHKAYSLTGLPKVQVANSLEARGSPPCTAGCFVSMAEWSAVTCYSEIGHILLRGREYLLLYGGAGDGCSFTARCMQIVKEDSCANPGKNTAVALYSGSSSCSWTQTNVWEWSLSSQIIGGLWRYFELRCQQ